MHDQARFYLSQSACFYITRPPPQGPFGIGFDRFFQGWIAFLILLEDHLLLSLDTIVEEDALLDEVIPLQPSKQMTVPAVLNIHIVSILIYRRNTP